MSRISDFIDYLITHVGDAYIWGAQGECISDMTESELGAFLERRETSVENESRALKYIARATKQPLYAFDCSGLIMHWFQNVKGWSEDKSAATLYNESDAKKLTATTKLEVGDLLFRHNGSKAYHVGVCVGDDMEIEAKGRDDGVVLRAVNRTYWTHYGKHPFLLVEEEASAHDKATTSVPKVISLTNPYMRGTHIKELQLALNGMGYDCGKADGIAGAKTIEGIQAFAAAHGKAAAPELPKTAECTVVIGGRKYTGEIKW